MDGFPAKKRPGFGSGTRPATRPVTAIKIEPGKPVTIARGRYAIFGEIASGGMATVWFGRLVGAVGFNRPVAIKRLHPQFAKDPEFRSMFLDEARMAARIRHQNVVPTLDVVASADELFLVMEYVQGESLWRLMKAAHARREAIPVPVATTLAAHILHGLHAAHEAKSETGEPLHIVHRDVSPQNVLVGVDGAARVLDFGVARATLRHETTGEGKVKGKLAYMAPEQLGGAAVSRKADIYAASVILWELLTGRRLFLKGDPQTVLIEKLFRGRPPKPSRFASGVTTALDDVVERGLSRDPKDRFASAREMAIALEECASMATPSMVSQWVEHLAHDTLAARSLKVSEFESCSLPAVAPSAPPPPMPGAPTPLAFDLRAPSPVPPDLVPSLSPMVRHASDAPIAPSSPPSTGVTLAPPPLAADPIGYRHERRPRRSLASLLEPDIDKIVVARVAAILGAERAKLVFASAFAVVGFAASVFVGVFVVRALGSVLFGHSDGSSTIATAPPAPPAAPVAAAPIPATPAPAPCPRGMLPIPGGKFFMGSDDDLPVERPSHHVTLAPYCMDAFEVTTEDYKACSDHGDCRRAGVTNDWASITNGERKVFDPLCNARDPIGRAHHPINCVDWEMASQYCRARGTRLPTEAEWEFAARSPDGRKYPWGDEEPTAKHLNACGKECVDWGRKNRVDEEAMYPTDDGWPTTAPVGSFPEGRSRYGVEDIVGNVWEWTSDWYAPYAAETQVNPKGPPRGAERVLRGGGWNGAYPAWVRPTFRYRDAPDKRSYGIGFRCAADAGNARNGPGTPSQP